MDEPFGAVDALTRLQPPSPGHVIEELLIDLARPRPLTLGEEPALARHAKRIYQHFARLGVIHRN